VPGGRGRANDLGRDVSDPPPCTQRRRLLDVLLQELEFGLQGCHARPLGAPRCLIIYVVDHEVGP
jgi:hypothetical protein